MPERSTLYVANARVLLGAVPGAPEARAREPLSTVPQHAWVLCRSLWV